MTDYDQIRSKILLSNLVKEYVPSLKSYGKDRYKALCPFHSERTPSFYLDDDKGTFVCYGCSIHGDVVDFLQNIEVLDHGEAVKRLKSEAGIEDLFMTKTQKRTYEIDQCNRLQKIAAFRKWKTSLILDLVMYTNAQWKVMRTTSRQYRITPTEELEKQIQDSLSEATSRESALDTLESMPDVDLMEWHDTASVWSKVKRPKWYLSSWRLDMARSAGGR